jgi:polysaccharide pyruvyl transferase WcaK-like protein
MKIGLLDHMGYGNLGDAATQEALIANIKRRLPEAVIIGFSLNPEDTRKRHNVSCYSITWWHPDPQSSDVGSTSDRNPGFQLKSIVKKIPVFYPAAKHVWHFVHELTHLGRSFRILRTLDSLIIAGGGQLSELWRGPWSHPYNVLKFCVLAKFANTKLLFLNVGAGPLNHPLSKLFARWSVCLADYVSFRDVESQTLVRELGVKRKTYVGPDSAYALDVTNYRTRNRVNASGRLVGINPIGFCDPRIWPRPDSSAYSQYLDKLAAFSLWLLAHHYRLRIFSGEVSVDAHAVEDLKARLLNTLPAANIDHIFKARSENVKDLFLEMAQFDFVVTSKFHGVVFSHLLQKPVIALSYHNKIDDLMLTVGHSQYCLDIEHFNTDGLNKAFSALVENAQELKSRFRQNVTSYADALQQQFDEVFLPEKPAVHCELQHYVPKVE